MRYEFLVDTYRTERVKILSVWSMFDDLDMEIRPRPRDARGRSIREQMVHQCVSEDVWFRSMLGVDVGAPPLPKTETRFAFIRRYAEDSGHRLAHLEVQPESWWEETVAFFDNFRTRAWILVRRISHSSHHRGQQMAMLRMLGREVYSNYGPTADTGGLASNAATVVYPYPDLPSLIRGEESGGRKAALPGPGDKAPTERP